MKKQLLLMSVACASLMLSCGDEKAEEKETVKTCKTLHMKDADCQDVENVDKISELAFTFAELSFLEGVGYAEFIATNESVLAEIEPLMPSLEKVLAIDPELSSEYFVEKIATVKTQIEDYKIALVDIESLVFTASWEKDPKFPKDKDVMVRFTNTSTKGISYLKGFMTYLDAAGNVLVEGDIAMYPFHFEPKIEGELIPVGYEGYCDMGLNIDKSQRALIKTVTFKLTEIKY